MIRYLCPAQTRLMLLIDLDLTRFQSRLQLSREGGQTFVFDPLRKKKLLLTPEEWIRQLLIQYLISQKGYPPGRLAAEQRLKVAGQNRRFDLLAYDKAGLPFLLAECKAPEVKINQKAFDQIAAYNYALRVPYLLLTNGPQTICCEMDYGKSSYRFLDEIPSP